MTTYDPDCDFCQIARGAQPVSTEIIARGEDWFAMFPLNPAAPGHTLVIPCAHVTDLWAFQAGEGAGLLDAVIRVGNAIRVALSPEGMNLITSAGRVAEQSVFHLHLHVVPRWRRDGFGEIWPTGAEYRDDTLADAADRIRDALTG